MRQFRPAVKSEARNFLCVGLVCFGRANGFVPEILDEPGIDGADENPGRREPGCHRLVVSAGMFHTDLRLAIKAFDGRDEVVDGGLRVTVIPRCQNNHIARLADRDSAFAFGNINTNCVHETIPFE